MTTKDTGNAAVTETQAGEMWCPMARMLDTGADRLDEQAGWNRQTYGADCDPNPELCRCIASRCMWWRWTTLHTPNADKRGYCGVAGSVLPNRY